MKNKVYIVTSGDYSEYRIECVFSTRKKAKEYIEQHGSDYRIEVYDVDSVDVVAEKRLWKISKDYHNGKVLSVSIISCHEFENCIDYKKYLFAESLDFYIIADSKSRAIKIAHERYGAVKANEHIMYPYLRERIIEDFFSNNFPMYDFFTGEVVVGANGVLEEYKDKVKTRTYEND